MLKSVFTNTSKPKAVIGLLFLTVGMAYCKENATEIVEGSVDALNNTKRNIEMKLRRNKKQYVVAGRDIDGNLYDTGRRIWK